MAYATIDELAQALKVRVTAENTPTLQSCLDAAAAEIDHDIDRPADETVATADWRYSSQTVAADPGPGYLRLDKTNPAAVARVYLDTIDADGVDLAEEMQGLAINDLLWIENATDHTRWEQFTVTDEPIDHAGWFEVPCTRTDTSGTALDLVADTLLTLAVLRPTALLTHQLALANRVNVLRGVEWYKANDAAFGVIGFDQTGALQAPRDGFNRHAYTLTPLKQQWGVA
jgi:hypothetical protein